MALSRLRHPLISSAPSLLKARFLSSSTTSLYRTFNSGIFPGGINGSLRPASLSLLSGVCDSSFKLKWVGVKYFSSADSSHVVLEMPALSPTMSQGNIAKWRKKEGDKIEVGDVPCEIETDKATLELESREEGFLAKILVSKDVPVGQPIAITVEDPNDIQNVPASMGGEAGIKEKKPTHQDVKDEEGKPESTSNKISTSELPPHILLVMPALSPTMACILAVGRGNKVVEPVIGTDGIESPSVVNKMNLTLSADHRVFGGNVAGAFLSALQSNFSDIRRLLL